MSLKKVRLNVPQKGKVECPPKRKNGMSPERKCENEYLLKGKETMRFFVTIN